MNSGNVTGDQHSWSILAKTIITVDNIDKTVGTFS
jgi:hypothetical protein